MISLLSRILSNNRASAVGFALTVALALCEATPAQRQRPPIPVQRQRPQPPSIPEVLVMRVDQGRITADISNTPLQKVIREFAERTGIIFEVRAEDNPRVSVHLYDVSFQEAVQRIATESNTMFFYDKEKPEHIALVRIFPRTGSVKQPSIIYLGTGSITKGNDDIDTPEQALRVLEESASLEARIRAIEILSQSASDDAVEALMKSISDESPEIRRAAIEGLASGGKRESLPKILSCLKDPNSEVRQSAVTAVALLGDESNLNDLRPLRGDKDAGVAAAVDTAIQKLSASVAR